MVKILQLLNKTEIIKSYEIQDFKHGEDFYYIKVQAKLVNETTLFIREYASEEDYNYSYHWQEDNSQLIIRWDNAPHHKQIKTFPHHKHIGEKVLPSYEIGIHEVLTYIDIILKN
ncbi:DUF6516 family protein [Desulfoscipio sp. XC116]|uniref:toxin-antitoxin system TumE family protein n=1 Tax=Desulfoscipio sp. XC116 TaxID=3144975 RepID=UPI00325BE4BB